MPSKQRWTMRRKSSKHAKSARVQRVERPLPATHHVWPVALALGMGSHAYAQTNPNDVAQSAIAAIAAMAAQSANQQHGADITKAAIEAITAIATSASNANATIATANATIASANATIAVVNAGGLHGNPSYRVQDITDVLDVKMPVLLDARGAAQAEKQTVLTPGNLPTEPPVKDTGVKLAIPSRREEDLDEGKKKRQAMDDADDARKNSGDAAPAPTLAPAQASTQPVKPLQTLASLFATLPKKIVSSAPTPSVEATTPEKTVASAKPVETVNTSKSASVVKSADTTQSTKADKPVKSVKSDSASQKSASTSKPRSTRKPATAVKPQSIESKEPTESANTVKIVRRKSVQPVATAPVATSKQPSKSLTQQPTRAKSAKPVKSSVAPTSAKTTQASTPIKASSASASKQPSATVKSGKRAQVAQAPVVSATPRATRETATPRAAASTPVVTQAAAVNAAPQRPATTSANIPASFNTSLLVFPVDVHMFAEGNPVPPGQYRLDVYLNDGWKGKHSIRFETHKPGERIAHPCFNTALLDTLGFDPKHIAPDAQARLQAGESICAPLEQLIPSTQSNFDSSLQRLNISAPQIALVRRVRGYVDPKRWDAGMTAATLAYDYNAWHNKQLLSSQTSHYVGLRGGINVGDWRFRYRGTITRNTGTGLRYRNSAFYVERALPSLQSAVLLGESNTNTQVFDSLSFLGVRLGSDDRMRPDSRNGFAPVINGIAQSNAKVSISQRGVQIFETTVPPGPFVIDDLSPNGSGGDLNVTITEADGSERSFTVSYAHLPELLRPGMTRYSVAAGRYRNRSLLQEPFFGVASVSHGFNNTVTGYGGLLAGQGYRALSAGVGLNLPIGAVMADATYANTVGVSTGYGFRVAYVKMLTATQTDISLAVLRTATRGYYEPGQAFQLRDAIKRNPSLSLPPHRRNQLSVSMHQPLPGKWGSLSLAGSVQDYWRRPGHDVQYSLGYGRNIGNLSMSLNAMRSRNIATGRWDNQYLLSFAMPLGSGTGNPAHLSTSLAHRSGGQTVQNSISGSSNGRQPFNYNAYTTLDKNHGQATRGGGGFSLSTITPAARVGGSVTVGAGDTQQFGMHASGGVVLFKGGVVFSPEMGETVGIVHAKNAQGVGLSSAPGVRLNNRGQAVVPHLQAYRENEVNLDPKGVSTDMELSTTSQKVVPTHGAVVLLEYETRHGYAILAKLRRTDGSAVPFAAGVFDAQGKNLGYLAQGGQALIRVDEPQGELMVRWGSRAEQQCRFRYDMSDALHADSRTPATGGVGQFRRVEMVCLS